MVKKSTSRILLVDDNPQNLQYLGNILEKNGYETIAVMNGFEALDFLKEEKTDLVLLDIMMPELDGYEVCRRLKADISTQSIPVIFLSGKAESEDIVEGFHVGGVDYVTKPFNPAELLARVKTHIEMKMLRGLIPICAKCKKVRDEKGFWAQIEVYFEEHSEVLFSHGICQHCEETMYGNQEWYKKKKSRENNT